MSGEQTGSELQQIGHINLNGRDVDVFAHRTQLPCDTKKRAACEGHIQEGRMDDLYSDFLMAGCDFPNGEQQPMVTIQFACNGLSKLTKQCRLSVTQYGENGEVLSKGSWKS